MKKLMLIAAIAMTASLANAAACTWSFTGLTQDNSGTSYTGYTAYLCDSAIWAADVLAADLANGDFSKLSTEGFVQNTANTVRQGTTSFSKIDSTKEFGSFETNSSHSFYTLVLNGDIGEATEFMTSATITAVAPSAGSMKMQYTNISSATGASEWTAVAVPEPTSGLLLLLGMAGLALKRKQA